MSDRTDGSPDAELIRGSVGRYETSETRNGKARQSERDDDEMLHIETPQTLISKRLGGKKEKIRLGGV